MTRDRKNITDSIGSPSAKKIKTDNHGDADEDESMKLTLFEDNETDLDLNCGTYFLLDMFNLPIGSFPNLKTPCVKLLFTDNSSKKAEFSCYGEKTKECLDLSIGSVYEIENFTWKHVARSPLFLDSIKEKCGMIREETVIHKNISLTTKYLEKICLPDSNKLHTYATIHEFCGSFNAELKSVDEMREWNKPTSHGTYCNAHWISSDGYTFKMVAFNTEAERLSKMSPGNYTIKNALPRLHGDNLEFTVAIGTTFTSMDDSGVSKPIHLQTVAEKTTLLELYDSQPVGGFFELSVFAKQESVPIKNSDSHQVLVCDSSLKDNKVLTIAMHVKDNLIVVQKGKYYIVSGYYSVEGSHHFIDVTKIQEDGDINTEKKEEIAEAIKHSQKYI